MEASESALADVATLTPVAENGFPLHLLCRARPKGFKRPSPSCSASSGNPPILGSRGRGRLWPPPRSYCLGALCSAFARSAVLLVVVDADVALRDRRQRECRAVEVARSGNRADPSLEGELVRGVIDRCHGHLD